MVRTFLAALLALAAPVATPPAARADEPLFEAKFMDGSVVMVSVAEASVAINTKYGRLTVPLSEVKKIDLGFRYPDGVADKVRAAVEDLGATDYKTREEAQKTLIAAGEYAVPAVKAEAVLQKPVSEAQLLAVLRPLVARKAAR